MTDLDVIRAQIKGLRLMLEAAAAQLECIERIVNDNDEPESIKDKILSRSDDDEMYVMTMGGPQKVEP